MESKATHLFIAILLGLLLTFAQTQSTPSRPETFLLTSTDHAGPGCPTGSVFTYLTTGGSLLLTLSALTPFLGPNIPIAEARRTCILKLNLEFPTDWSFTLSSYTLRGYMSLADGISVTYHTGYHFEEQPEIGGSVRSGFEGPIEGDVLVLEDELAEVWTSCVTGNGTAELAERVLGVNISARVEAKSPSAVNNPPMEDGEIVIVLDTKWKRCE